MDLEDFYFNGIYPMELEGHTPDSADYKQTTSYISELEGRLLNIIDREAEHLYRELKDCLTKASGIEAAHAFKVGYRLGGQMILEITKENE